MVTVTDAFLLPFTDGVLDAVADHDIYSFPDGFRQEKKAFITDWGVFVAVVMMFGLKTAPATFQRIITKIFHEYILGFMQIFLDDFAVYSLWSEHQRHLRLCLERCRTTRPSLNPAKCTFGVSSGTFLDHIVREEGITIDPSKV